MRITNRIAHKLRCDFPIFKNNPKLVYLDNAATSQRLGKAIEAVKSYSEKDNANVGRGIYHLSEMAMQMYDSARKTIAKFINASPEEVIFTGNTTGSLNMLSYTLKSILPKGKNEILLTEMEHHSNLVPWQQMAKRHKMKIKFVRVKDNFILDMDDFKKKLGKKTAIVSVAYASNTLGTVNPVKEITKLAHKKGALVIVDAAQSIQHIETDVKAIDCDFLAFSSHKMLGPTGLGVLYGKKKILEKLPPFLFGGGMIKNVTFQNATWADLPEKFEAGTQNVAEAIGLAESIRYISRIGIENIGAWENDLERYALMKLKEVPEIEIYHPFLGGGEQSVSVISFNLKGVHPHDVASLLDSYRVAVRAGHNCAIPLMKKLGLRGGVCRASLAFYNTFEDVDRLVHGLKAIQRRFK